jgi:hypothetical protein
VKTVQTALRRCGQQFTYQGKLVRSNYLTSTSTGSSDQSSGGFWNRKRFKGTNILPTLIILPLKQHGTTSIRPVPMDNQIPIEKLEFMSQDEAQWHRFRLITRSVSAHF